MEPDKSLKEALLRSHQATEKANQAQHQLYNIGTGAENPTHAQPEEHQRKLHETPRNLIQSWDTLRQLDEELANKKTDEKDNENSKNKV
ncbi:MAG: hypothetical protein LPK09_07160 [Hymenobacteraceae bacterium]|nr:hypothetical protein [Hymenobacteraceae bacterium]